jgi:hypothetical protein
MPSFRQWLKATALDVFTMFVYPHPLSGARINAFWKVNYGRDWTWSEMFFMPGAIYAHIAQVYFAKPAATRSFPVLFNDGDIVYPQFAYPLRKEIVPIWAAAMLGFFVPFVVFMICQIRVRSFWDFNNAVSCIPLILATCTCVDGFL